jgi:hypothetical protein
MAAAFDLASAGSGIASPAEKKPAVRATPAALREKRSNLDGRNRPGDKIATAPDGASP